MKKKIIIIDGDDPSVGTDIDVSNYLDFFCSAHGGFWEEREIKTIKGENSSFVRAEIEACRKEQLAYCICIFVGHGGMFEINNRTHIYTSDKSLLEEDELYEIAPKQLTILDCCRSYDKSTCLIGESVKASGVCLHRDEDFVNIVREEYEARIQHAIAFQYVLYACGKNGVSQFGDGTGGLFSYALINSYKMGYDEEEYLTINKAFIRAKEECQKITLSSRRYQPQIPKASLHRNGSNHSVIWAINPQYVSDLCSSLARYHL